MIDTPALIIDLDRLEQNLDRMAALAREAGVALRPHIKTHKSLEIARLQLARGSAGLACAKLGEAEVMADAGLGPLLVTTEVTGPRKLARLADLAARADVTCVFDDAGAAEAASACLAARGVSAGALVDVHVGQERTGVDPDSARALAARLAALPGLRFRGFQGYEGHLQHVYDQAERRARSADATARLLRAAAGTAAEVVTTAGTGTAAFAAGVPGVTELQPGSYVFMDCDYARVEGVPFAVALTVDATVVSRQRDGVAILDAGWKALSTDAGLPVAAGHPEWVYSVKGDEHGALSGPGLPAVGERVTLIPSHCDTTVNLYDRYHVKRGGELVGSWAVAARGRTQ